MKIIVGLGNPGSEYSATRHNIGFMVIDELAHRWNVENWRERLDASVAEYRAGAETVLLVKPRTYMNRSGTAVGALARWYKVSPEDIIVACDDLDLPVGRLRLRLKGGSGGHRGIESLLVHIGQEDFIRVRTGIGRPPAGREVVDHVLTRFSADEAPVVKKALGRAADAIECILREGADRAMNKFNK